MGYRKVINRMVKAQQRSSEECRKLAEAGRIGTLRIPCTSNDTEVHNVCVEAYNVHVKIWNQLQRYITQLKRKQVKA